MLAQQVHLMQKSGGKVNISVRRTGTAKRSEDTAEGLRCCTLYDIL